MTSAGEESTVPQSAPGGAWRVAGGLLLAVGALNTLTGLASVAGSDVAALSTGGAVGLAVLGLVTLAAGVVVWRGSRSVALLALTLFGILLLVQLGDLVGGEIGPPAVGRVAVLALIVAALAVAVTRAGGRR